MKWEGDLIRLSASDLMRFMACAHASALDLDHLYGRGPEPAEDSEDAALLQRHGDAHEAAHLEGLRRDGGVVEIDRAITAQHSGCLMLGRKTTSAFGRTDLSVASVFVV